MVTEQAPMYLGEELDVVADRDEVEVLVELEDVNTAARAPGVEDDGVPPRWSSLRDRLLHRRRLLLGGGGDAALSPKNDAATTASRGSGDEVKDDEKQGSNAAGAGEASHGQWSNRSREEEPATLTSQLSLHSWLYSWWGGAFCRLVPQVSCIFFSRRKLTNKRQAHFAQELA